jgi:PhnB protein
MGTANVDSSKPRAADTRKLATVMPFMYIRDPDAALEFYRTVFGAQMLMREAADDGEVHHAMFQIGESRFMISNPAAPGVNEYAKAGWARTPHELGGTPVHLYLQVEDADAAFSKAIAAGAKLVHEMGDMEWGDRVGGFQDPWGHIWYAETPLR